MSGTPVPSTGIVVSPPSARYHGHPVKVNVWNSGSTPVTIHAEALILRGGCAQQYATGMVITPSRFTLHPHGGRQVVTVKVPATVGDYGALFVESNPLHENGVTVNKAHGFQIYQGAGTHGCVVVHKHPKAAPVSHGNGGIPLIPVVVGGAFVLLALLALITWRSYSKRHRTA